MRHKGQHERLVLVSACRQLRHGKIMPRPKLPSAGASTEIVSGLFARCCLLVDSDKTGRDAQDLEKKRHDIASALGIDVGDSKQPLRARHVAQRLDIEDYAGHSGDQIDKLVDTIRR